MYRSFENIGGEGEAEGFFIVFSSALNSAASVLLVGCTASKYFLVALPS